MGPAILRRLAATSTALSLLAACGGGSDSAGNTPPTQPPVTVTKGSVVVKVTGLRAGAVHLTTVTGPGGYSATATDGDTLRSLAPGSYTVTPSSIGDLYFGFEGVPVPVTVSVGATATATVAYTPTVFPRTTTNRQDIVLDYRIKPIYALPSDGVDQNRDTDGSITRSLISGQRWLYAQTGHRHLRYDVAIGGGLDIAFVRLPRTEAQYFSYNAQVRDSIEKDLNAAGFNIPKTLLLTYYEGRHVDRCASAAWPPTVPGNTAVLYMNGAPTSAVPCSTQKLATSASAAPGYMEFLFLHEVFHLLGVVSTSAPDHALAGHVGNDPTDLMYAGPLVWRPAVVDITKSNYFNAGALAAGVTNFTNSVYVQIQ
jgi:hypothetical protein